MAQSKVEDLTRMLECPICLERIKSPRMLPCLHSFCEGCLARHMVEKGVEGLFPCPTCMTNFEVPKSGVQEFKRNCFLAEMSEIIFEREDIKCDKCKVVKSDTTATSKCLQCKDNLCKPCSEYHCLGNVASIEENGKSDEASSQRKHPDDTEMVLVRCFSTRLPGESPADHQARGMCVIDDKIVITDGKYKSVKVFDKVIGDYLFQASQFLRHTTITGGFSFGAKQNQEQNLAAPRDVTCRKTGEMFVTDDSVRCVVRYDTEGKVIKVIDSVGYASTDGEKAGYIICHNDQLVVAEQKSGQIVLADLDGVVKKTITQESLGLRKFTPTYMCVDNEGHLVVTDPDQDRLYIIDYNKPAIIKTFTLTRCVPYGVCVDRWGSILVADHENNRVVSVSATSDHVVVLREVVKSLHVFCPSAIAISGPGEVAVLEYYSGIVRIFKYRDV